MATKDNNRSVLIPLGNMRDVVSSRQGGVPVGVMLALVVVALPLVLTYSLATASEYVVIVFFLMLITAFVILKWPFVGLNILMLMLYIRPEENIEEIRGLRLFFSISLLTLFSLAVKHFVGSLPLRRNPTMLAVSVFCFFVLVSASTNGSLSVAFVEMANIAAFMFIILDQIDSKDKYVFVVRNLICCALFVSVFSIYLYYTGASMNQHGVYRSIGTGIFSDPNDLSSAIIPGLALSLSYVNKRDLASLCNLLVSGICLYAIVLTGSRGAVLGLVSVFVTFIFVNGRVKKGLIIPIIVSIALLFALAPKRMMDISSEDESANSRLLFWINGIRHFINQPVLGIGFNGFPDINDGFTAHNSFVLCFTEVGFLGYFFWMSCIYFAYKALLINRSHSGVYVNGMLMALNGFLTCCFFLSRTYNLVFMMILGISSSCMTAEDSSQSVLIVGKKDLIRIFFLSVFSIISIYLIARFLA